MDIDLKDINMQNFEQCLKLHTYKSQKNFVETVVYSLAEAKADKISVPLAVYHEGVMVGFTMYFYDKEKHEACISRLMIDFHHQHKGYGRETLKRVINRILKIKECKSIWLSYHPQNEIAEKLYVSMGFDVTTDTYFGEKVCRMKIRD